MAKLFERRLTPADSPLAIFATTAARISRRDARHRVSVSLLRRESASRRTSRFFTSLSRHCADSATRWCGLRRWL